MALAAQPTIKHYCPDDRIFYGVKKQIIQWFKSGLKVPDRVVNNIFSDLEQIGKSQASGEAYNILYATLNSLDPENAYTAVLDILYYALTGDAISGFSAAKRDIFNWFIVEVIPSAYC